MDHTKVIFANNVYFLRLSSWCFLKSLIQASHIFKSGLIRGIVRQNSSFLKDTDRLLGCSDIMDHTKVIFANNVYFLRLLSWCFLKSLTQASHIFKSGLIRGIVRQNSSFLKDTDI